MESSMNSRRVLKGLALTGAILLVSGCAHVNEEDLATEMEVLRQEMRTQDEAVEQRLTERVDTVESEMERRLAGLESALGDLRGEFEVTVERLESAIRFNAPVHFAFDDDTIRDQDREILDRFAQVASAYYEGATITIEGFTDSAGPAEYNQRLGEARAESVRDYLAGQGLPADRMRTVSYGEAAERQITDGTQGPGETGWQNRRVAMVIDFSGMAGEPPVALAPNVNSD